MLALFLAALVPIAPLTPSDVLANVRRALTVSSAAAAWPETVLSGSAEFRGVTHGYRLQFRRDGEFCQSMDGKLSQTLGCDGKSFWQIDSSGATRHLAFEDVDRVETVLLLLTDRWLDPNAPVDCSASASGPSAGTYALHLILRVSGLDETVQVDSKTWLPKSAEFEIASSKTTIALSDWRPAGSVRVPFLAKVTDAGLTDTYRVDTARSVREGSASTYSMPDLSPADISYDTAISPSIETKRAQSGHILVHPRIDGKDVGWFILDSGADSMVIDQAKADSLGLPKLGKESVVGVGGVVVEPFRTSSTFTLGPATMKNVTFIEFDLHQLSDIFKVPLAGIVGFDFFRRFIVEVDLKKPAIGVHDVRDFHLDRGDWSAMEFSSGNPAVLATFEGDHKAWFRLDTGANGTVTFHAPAVQQMHLLTGRETTPAGMAGVGGTSEARLGKLAWFELGGHRFENVTAVFSLAKVGAFADRYLTGNIGQDLMEPFTMVFDFGGSRVAFVPH
jgi:predicted aspartyl protease